MKDAIKSFWDTYWLTLVVGIIACVCVGILVELFKQALFSKLEKKYSGDPDEPEDPVKLEKLTKIKTIKAGCAFALAALLTAFFLACLWKSKKLPNIGDAAVLPIWYTAMYLLQLFVDIKSLKNIFGRILGNIVKATEPKKPKLIRKKETSYVYYDEDGNEVKRE